MRVNKKMIIGCISLVLIGFNIVLLQYMNVEANMRRLGLNNGYDNISIVKSCEGRLSRDKENRIIIRLIKGIGGKIVHEKKYDKNRRLIYGYTPFLNNRINYKGKEINLNIVITYMEDMNITSIHLATPVVNIDY